MLLVSSHMHSSHMLSSHRVLKTKMFQEMTFYKCWCNLFEVSGIPTHGSHAFCVWL